MAWRDLSTLPPAPQGLASYANDLRHLDGQEIPDPIDLYRHFTRLVTRLHNVLASYPQLHNRDLRVKSLRSLTIPLKDRTRFATPTHKRGRGALGLSSPSHWSTAFRAETGDNRCKR